jgi:hypothetical protein
VRPVLDDRGEVSLVAEGEVETCWRLVQASTCNYSDCPNFPTFGLGIDLGPSLASLSNSGSVDEGCKLLW